MAIDEQDVFAGVAEDADTADEHAGAPSSDARTDLSLDELRHRLDSPLYAREHGLAASSQVPGLRELTWDHVTNPTTSHPVVPGESIFDGDDAGVPRPAPLKLDELLARPAVTLKPIEPLGPPAGAVAAPSGPAVDVAEGPPAVVTGDVGANSVAPSPRAPLPSFADILASSPASADAAITEAGGVDAPGVDSLIKPIDERPPVARDTDPLVSGLAELIVQSTPGVGMPRVAELREVSRADTGMVPFVPEVPMDPPVLDAKVEFANVSTTVPVIPPPPDMSTGTTEVHSGGVEAEMNRLAFLPDQDDEVDGPVEVPEIAYSDVRSAEPVAAAPVISLSQGDLYQPRPSASPVRHNFTDLLTGSVGVIAPPRRRRRHIVRNFITIVVLSALAAGGLFAVKQFVLDRVVWTAELEPLVREVEATRGLEFEQSLTVESLDAADYAERIVDSVAGYPEVSRAIDEAELRAVGLANESFDASKVGLSAMADSPAFYDPVDGKIYIVAELNAELERFAMHRALALALLDQRFDWSARIADASPAVARGTRALYEGDAMAVAQQLLLDDGDETRQKITEQLFAIYAQYEIPVSSAPFVSASAGRFGLALDRYFLPMSPEERNLLETRAAVSDAQVLDLRRLVAGQAEQVGTTARGMLFWYHALAGRVGDDVAWRVALAWQDDATSTEPDNGPTCTNAVIDFAAAAGDAVNAAFTAWAAAAPAASNTKVAVGAPAGGRISVTVDACDPGKVATHDATFSPSLGGAPLRAEQFTQLVQGEQPLAAEKAACVVHANDADTISAADEPGLVDPVGGWKAPGAHQVDTATTRCT